MARGLTTDTFISEDERIPDNPDPYDNTPCVIKNQFLNKVS